MKNSLNYNHKYFHSLLILGLISVCGSFVYWFYKLSYPGIILSLLLAILTYIIIRRYSKNDNENWHITIPAPTKETSKKQQPLGYLFNVIYLLLAASCFYVLCSAQTSASIISPWQVVPAYFFILYTLTTAVLIFSFRYNSIFNLALIIFHYLLSFSVAIIVYRLYYGFDPFIHEATLNLIDEAGAAYPKPFYYIGQYSLMIILHKLLFIPLVALNKFLVPFLAAVFLPLTFHKVLKQWFKGNGLKNLTIILMLIFPFSYFIITTPQSLAFLFLVLVILLGLICTCLSDLILILVLALAAIVAHPIAGIPALLFAIILTLYHRDNKKFNKLYYTLVFLTSSAALPLAFWYVNKSQAGTNIDAPTPIQATASLFSFSLPNSEHIILNILYFFIFNFIFLLLILIIAGLVIAFKNKKHCRIYPLYFLMSLSLLLSYYLTSRLNFDYLINYERTAFSDRILLAAFVFLLPFIIISLYGFVLRLKSQNNFIKYTFLLLGVLLVTASLYSSYPRFDNYFNSRGYSTGESDFNAIRWININASSSDYIVLANQQVSAAALYEFGFKKYYKSEILNLQSEIFYYPIPTASPLYKYYLDMVYENPSRATMEEAMNLVGVSESYFILNKYWWAFDKILEEVKLNADSWEKIDNGNLYVFKYTK